MGLLKVILGYSRLLWGFVEPHMDDIRAPDSMRI